MDMLPRHATEAVVRRLEAFRVIDETLLTLPLASLLGVGTEGVASREEML
jgi:hypothetical protein